MRRERYFESRATSVFRGQSVKEQTWERGNHWGGRMKARTGGILGTKLRKGFKRRWSSTCPMCLGEKLSKELMAYSNNVKVIDDFVKTAGKSLPGVQDWLQERNWGK